MTAMELPMFDFKRRESLRCLLASVASIAVINWFDKNRQLDRMAIDAEDINDRLADIGSFFMVAMGGNQLHHRDLLATGFGLALPRHVRGVLFADAVRWWAAAHRSRQDENKYLRPQMYEDKFTTSQHYFYHKVRNNYLSHFPGGEASNEIRSITPSPYPTRPSKEEYDDFRSLLAYSISLACKDALEVHRNEVNWFSNVYGSSPKETNSAAVAALDKMLRDFFNELAVSTKNHPPESQNE